ncbi:MULTISPECIES: DUF4236 domain-containing protein [Bacillus]|uniref:DUF4236 domain-containing protein n=1 Tax=Bacillus TaxID=1386 RepID=UPI0002D99EE5|nr:MULTISPECIES: DUF4236 domain-containing protein [Bacillus]
MALGFRKSFKIAPGVRLNVNKKGLGLSAGIKGFRYSVNTSGHSRTTASIPGTGLSYTTTKNRNSRAYKRQRELLKKERENQKLAEAESNRLQVQLFNNKLRMLKSIHIEADIPIDWHSIAISNAPDTFYEKEATNIIQQYKPSFFTKLFRKEEKERSILEQNLKEAKQKDIAARQSWEETVSVAKKVLEGDVDTYFQLIETMAPFNDISAFGSGFEFFAEDSKTMEIDFDVHSHDVVPSELLTLTKTGKVSTKAMPKGRYYDIQQDYVCSCIIRIARDIFALLPIETVYIHANDEIMDTSIGHMKERTILSVRIDRETLEKLNFENIDCSDALQNFQHNMKWKKLSGFYDVPKLEITQS